MMTLEKKHGMKTDNKKVKKIIMEHGVTGIKMVN